MTNEQFLTPPFCILCESSKESGKTHCKNTFDGFVCQCDPAAFVTSPTTNKSELESDCLDLNECRTLSLTDSCTCDRCACHNFFGGYEWAVVAGVPSQNSRAVVSVFLAVMTDVDMIIHWIQCLGVIQAFYRVMTIEMPRFIPRSRGDSMSWSCRCEEHIPDFCKSGNSGCWNSTVRGKFYTACSDRINEYKVSCLPVTVLLSMSHFRGTAIYHADWSFLETKLTV